MLTVVRASGLVTVQDLGRPGRMHEAIPPGGAMVPELCVAANRAVQNPDGAATIEVMGVLVVRAEHETRIAIDDDGEDRLLREGEELAIAPARRRVSYLAIRGGVDAPVVLGSRGTLLCAGLGRMLRKGDAIAAHTNTNTSTSTSTSTNTNELGSGDIIRVVPGPDGAYFSPDAIAALTATPYRISHASDRVGTRLEGTRISRAQKPECSRPMVRGAIEVPLDGLPIVLGPEHPTTGGYPLVAVIAASDLGRFFSVPLGGTVRFAAPSEKRK